MVAERVLTRPLVVFLLVVAALVVRALNDRFGPRDLDGIVAELGAQDLEGHERRRLLARVRAAALEGVDPEPRLWAAMAAVGLDDRAGFDRATGVPHGDAWLAAGQAWWAGPDRDEVLKRAGLGDPVLAALLRAAAAEADGDRDAARRRYEQVVASARLFHMDLAVDLARAGAGRLP